MTVKAAHMVSKGYIRAWANAKKIVDVLDLQDGGTAEGLIDTLPVRI
jgi:hypothetical protein